MLYKSRAAVCNRYPGQGDPRAKKHNPSPQNPGSRCTGAASVGRAPTAMLMGVLLLGPAGLSAPDKRGLRRLDSLSRRCRSGPTRAGQDFRVAIGALDTSARARSRLAEGVTTVLRSLMCCAGKSALPSGRPRGGGNGGSHHYNSVCPVNCVLGAWGRLLLASDGRLRHLLLFCRTRCAGSKLVRRSSSCGQML